MTPDEVAQMLKAVKLAMSAEGCTPEQVDAVQHWLCYGSSPTLVDPDRTITFELSQEQTDQLLGLFETHPIPQEGTDR